ncbi:hypothetical protein AVEN_103894-1 [Araneus ventricosus]|uniref:Uncharacterized protein n=1 Tax=Araneus ventricosus TaxID=182803 RepID=A0A4Y2MJP8_ARAVE|nr:hypothetical protein AVEN_103894-1 [Araneus ventricosus]
MATPPPAFKTGFLASLSRESFTSPFCGFRFCERASLPFSRIVFQFYDRMRQMENERRWISKLFDHNSPILVVYPDFGARGSKWCGTELS